jgi:hypothetical protein
MVIMQDHYKIIATGIRVGGLYKLDVKSKNHQALASTTMTTSQHNGVAERKNKTLVACAQTMLQGKNISNGFWAEAICIVTYLKKLCPTKFLDHKTPFQSLYGYKPTIIHLRIFVRKDFSHVPKVDRRKLD